MSLDPGALAVEQQPPMAVPLRHFVLGLGFLLVGIGLGLGILVGVAGQWATLAHVHLLLVGWICITIMGAMTQFVPVWSGVDLYSRRLATGQLWLVAIGVVGFAGSLLAGATIGVVGFGLLMLSGFWVFVYNLARTLWGQESYDVTERHFVMALGFFLFVTSFGFVLAVDYVQPVIDGLAVARANVVATHATLAVFGAVMTTIVGALYQLGPMFTQTELHGIEPSLRTVEELAYPVGVVLLAGGRLVGIGPIGRIGGVLVASSLLGVSVLLGRRLYESRVDWTPMLSRYAVVAPLLALWSVLALVAWSRDPLARSTLFGAPGSGHLLVLGVIGFVVFGTLYHIVPFIIWVHRYSDRLGFEDVPMIDDLYHRRIATVDFGLLVGGLVGLVGVDWLGGPPLFAGIAGTLVLAGGLLFVGNMLLVIRDHSPHSLAGVLFSTLATEGAASIDDSDAGDTAP